MSRPALVAVSSIGLVAVIGFFAGAFGVAAAVMVLITLVVPATFTLAFWHLARQRLALSTRRISAQSASYRANTELLGSIAHELNLHPELTNLREEVRAVVIEYQETSDEIRVVVPDLAVETDPFALRQVLHTLVANAVQHGGDRLAIWGTVGESQIKLTVSDDGPGVAQELTDGLFERFVDLGSTALASERMGRGLFIAWELSGLMGGQMSYDRDSVWSHFTLSLPIQPRTAPDDSALIDIEVEASKQ